jgi:hypothetical protein
VVNEALRRVFAPQHYGTQVCKGISKTSETHDRIALCSGGNVVAHGVRGSYPAISDAGRDVARASSSRYVRRTCIQQ